MNSRFVTNRTWPRIALLKVIRLLSLTTVATILALGTGPAKVAQAALQHVNDRSNSNHTNYFSQSRSGTAAPLLQGSYIYTIALPDDTFVVMGDQTAVLPFAVANDASSSGNIESVKIGLPASVYWVSTATTAPNGWKITQIKNAGAGQAWVHFEAISVTNAIEPSDALTFNVVLAGTQLGVFPSSDGDETDTVDFVTVEGPATFTSSAPMPTWDRKALTVALSASPSSLGVDNLVSLTMDVFNRSTITQTSVVPTTTATSGNGGVTLATGPSPTELSVPPGEAACFTWTYTATASGDVVFGNSASNSVASSVSGQSNTVLIGDFTAALTIEPTQIISGQLTTVNMTVKNNAESTITSVTPSALSPLGTATVTLASGPTPASVASLVSGATASFQWVYTTTGNIGATYQFTGTASSGSGVSANEAASPQGVIKKYTVSVTPRYEAVGTITQTFNYVIANNGGFPVKLVEFTLPLDFTYNAGNASGGYGVDWSITKDGGGNPKIIRFEAPTIPTDTLPVGSLATFTITFDALPSSATDYSFPVRIVDTGGAEKTENAVITMTEYDVTIEASPSSGVYADGVSTSIITATVVISGTAQPDQKVNFYTTKGVLSPETGTTDTSGVATTTLTAPQSNEDTSALVTASCSGAQDEIIIYYIGSHRLTVNVVGNGSVAKNPDQAGYHYSDVVTLTANADAGWSFAGWSGDLSGSGNPDTITMDGDKVVTATFTQDGYTLTVDVVGNGFATVDPDQASYHYGDVVTLTANADAGWSFTGWSGDLSGSDNPDTMTMDGDKVVTATFTAIEYTPTLTITKDGPVEAQVGENVVYTFTVTHAPTSDGSPLHTVSVTDSVAGPATLASGDDGNGELELGETWVFTAGYRIQITDPNPLVNVGTVVAKAANGADVSAQDTHSTAVGPSAAADNFTYLPLVMRVYAGPVVR